MGFWHTGYMEFHEPTGWGSGSGHKAPPPPVFPCQQCGVVFSTADDLNVHLFDGHATARPILLLRGRECGRSRLSVIEPTMPGDWNVRNATAVRVNGERVPLVDVGVTLSQGRNGVVSVELLGERADQEFEFSFSIADDRDLDGVDGRLHELIDGRSLTIHAIDQFIERTSKYGSARRYRDGVASYLYGVLAREGSADSGLTGNADEQPAYAGKYDEAVASLGHFDRPAAEAVCGLVAFHYNQFDLALRKTRSPRVARASRRLAGLLAGQPPQDRTAIKGRSSLDYALSDSETESVLTWCCISLDGTAADDVKVIERAIDTLEPSDQVKLHVIAAEHHLTLENHAAVVGHVGALRHSRVAEHWIASVRERLEG